MKRLLLAALASTMLFSCSKERGLDTGSNSRNQLTFSLKGITSASLPVGKADAATDNTIEQLDIYMFQSVRDAQAGEDPLAGYVLKAVYEKVTTTDAGDTKTVTINSEGTGKTRYYFIANAAVAKHQSLRDLQLNKSTASEFELKTTDIYKDVSPAAPLIMSGVTEQELTGDGNTINLTVNIKRVIGRIDIDNTVPNFTATKVILRKVRNQGFFMPRPLSEALIAGFGQTEYTCELLDGDGDKKGAFYPFESDENDLVEALIEGHYGLRGDAGMSAVYPVVFERQNGDRVEKVGIRRNNVYTLRLMEQGSNEVVVAFKVEDWLVNEANLEQETGSGDLAISGPGVDGNRVVVGNTAIEYVKDDKTKAGLTLKVKASTDWTAEVLDHATTGAFLTIGDVGKDSVVLGVTANTGEARKAVIRFRNNTNNAIMQDIYVTQLHTVAFTIKGDGISTGTLKATNAAVAAGKLTITTAVAGWVAEAEQISTKAPGDDWITVSNPTASSVDYALTANTGSTRVGAIIFYDKAGEGRKEIDRIRIVQDGTPASVTAPGLKDGVIAIGKGAYTAQAFTVTGANDYTIDIVNGNEWIKKTADNTYEYAANLGTAREGLLVVTDNGTGATLQKAYIRQAGMQFDFTVTKGGAALVDPEKFDATKATLTLDARGGDYDIAALCDSTSATGGQKLEWESVLNDTPVGDWIKQKSETINTPDEGKGISTYTLKPNTGADRTILMTFRSKGAGTPTIRTIRVIQKGGVVKPLNLAVTGGTYDAATQTVTVTPAAATLTFSSANTPALAYTSAITTAMTDLTKTDDNIYRMGQNPGDPRSGVITFTYDDGVNAAATVEVTVKQEMDPIAFELKTVAGGNCTLETDGSITAPAASGSFSIGFTRNQKGGTNIDFKDNTGDMLSINESSDNGALLDLAENTSGAARSAIILVQHLDVDGVTPKTLEITVNQASN